MKRQLFSGRGRWLLPVLGGLALLLMLIIPARNLRADPNSAQPAADRGAAGALAAAQAVTPTATAAEPVTGSAPVAAVPAFLTIQPAAGFPLDPFLVSLQGGGAVAASTLAGGCRGYIPANPAVSVDFKGAVGSLTVFFYSEGDTTLVIQTPDGAYRCNDNTNPIILDPTLTITNPAAGQYHVWVGAGAAQDLIPGFLVFTSRDDVGVGSFALRDLVRRRLQPEVLPVRPRIQNAENRIAQILAAAQPENTLPADGVTVTQALTLTGDLPAVELQTGDTLCGGLVTLQPDAVFDWAGEGEAVSLMVEADGDTTLLVRTPDGSFLCADDTGAAEAGVVQNLNPTLTIVDAVDGRYLVWVGRVNAEAPVSATLTVAAAPSLSPQILQK